MQIISMLRRSKRTLSVIALWFGMQCTILTAIAEQTLPDPLTLDFVLQQSSAETSLLLVEHQAKLQQLTAERSRISDAMATKLDLELRGRLRTDPLVSYSETYGDHRAALLLNAPLYDFGRNSGLQQAVTTNTAAQQLRHQQQQWQQRALLMQLYYDVLLADMVAGEVDEGLSIDYIRYDRLKERMDLGQASLLQVSELESKYQQTLNKRSRAINQQRLTRSKLAAAIGFPGQLSANLVEGELPSLPAKLPEFAEVRDIVLQNNLSLQAQQQEIDAITQKIAATDKGMGALLAAEAELARGSKGGDGTNRWRFGVKLTVPLFGASTTSQQLQLQAQLQQFQLQYEQLRRELENSALEVWLRLSDLQQQRKAAQVRLHYRELYLDNSRANYEMEFASDLGDAMVQMSSAQTESKRIAYDIAVAIEQLNGLMNGGWQQLLQQITEPEDVNNGEKS